MRKREKKESELEVDYIRALRIYLPRCKGRESTMRITPIRKENKGCRRTKVQGEVWGSMRGVPQLSPCPGVSEDCPRCVCLCSPLCRLGSISEVVWLPDTTKGKLHSLRQSERTERTQKSEELSQSLRESIMAEKAVLDAFASFDALFPDRKSVV